MRVFRDINELPKFKNPVISIGTYDGVHLGHQKIIQRLNTLANELGGESIIITFHPHPRSVVNVDARIQLLSTLDEKIDLLRHYGLHNLVVVPFTRAFSQQSPEAYVQDFLYNQFRPKVVVIGYNHKFGKNRQGDFSFLQEKASELDFNVEEIKKQEVEALAISSTKIREALLEGNVHLANALLGHLYAIRGLVVKGQQIGKTIGFPTANVHPESEDKLIPRTGAYAVQVNVGGAIYNGMLNIGLRPTFNGEEQTIETHIFDFDRDLYGETIQVNFIKRIREERKFDTPKALVEQLEKDKQTALDVLVDIPTCK